MNMLGATKSSSPKQFISPQQHQHQQQHQQQKSSNMRCIKFHRSPEKPFAEMLMFERHFVVLPDLIKGRMHTLHNLF